MVIDGYASFKSDAPLVSQPDPVADNDRAVVDLKKKKKRGKHQSEGYKPKSFKQRIDEDEVQEEEKYEVRGAPEPHEMENPDVSGQYANALEYQQFKEPGR